MYLFAVLLPAMAQAQDIDKEISLGRQLASGVESRATLIADPAIVEYVNGLGQELARHADSKLPPVLKVMEGSEAHAMTLPGGFCYLTAGLMLTAESEAELAGAIAHQLGHIAAWHEKGRVNNQLALLVAPDGMLYPPWSGLCLRGTSTAALPMGWFKDQGDREAEADQLGLEYLYQSGYDPTGLADFYQRILAQGDRKGSVSAVFMPWLVFPPATRSQADSLRNNLASYIVTTSAFNDMQRRLRALQPVAPKGPVPSLR